jgi:hypothetical protein
MSLPKPAVELKTLDFDPSVGLMRLDGRDLMVDRVEDDPVDGYQREFEQARAEAYGRAFQWGLFGTPLVNLRDDGKYWVVSGQHRLAAAGYAGIEAIEVGIYSGLTRQQEAYLFNQEATQRRDLTALDKFWSGFRSGFEDHVGVANIVERVGGKIAYKSSPRIGNVNGITAVQALLTAYDKAGPVFLEEALIAIREGFGSLTGKAVDKSNIVAMTQFMGVYRKGSKYGYADRKKLIVKLKEYSPEALRADARAYEGKGVDAARFYALVDLYNYKLQVQNRLEEVRPDWRGSKFGSPVCIFPGCQSGRSHKPGNAYRRELCRMHYDLMKAGKLPMMAPAAVTSSGRPLGDMLLKDPVHA